MAGPGPVLARSGHRGRYSRRHVTVTRLRALYRRLPLIRRQRQFQFGLVVALTEANGASVEVCSRSHIVFRDVTDKMRIVLWSGRGSRRRRRSVRQIY